MPRKQVLFTFDENMPIMRARGKCKGAECIGAARIPNWQLDTLSVLDYDLSTIAPQTGAGVWVTGWRVDLSTTIELDNYYCYPMLRTKIPMTVIIDNKRVYGFTYVLNNQFYLFSRTKPLSTVKKELKKAYANYHVFSDEGQASVF